MILVQFARSWWFRWSIGANLPIVAAESSLLLALMRAPISTVKSGSLESPKTVLDRPT
ncbi:hypothetical protein [Changpingibacter yushuensis]|uniref:hypothetical protein n=1 Tax=Changpingibacter yushuensis TaxID=2758440 RepID=UPI0015F5D455|nr:hypothetical protein [Changpingibacter yushuensis]